MEYLRQLSPFDGYDIYNLLQHINEDENAFTNPVKKMTYEEYKKWLIIQDAWSRGEQLPLGFVGQTSYWLIVDDQPVAYGKIRHALTPDSRLKGGNIGYAVSNEFRCKGYGTKILSLLLRKSCELNINEVLLTVEKYNIASKRVIEKNGGKLINENQYRWFYSF